MWIASSKQKVCATCQNWQGERRLHSDLNIETRTPTTMGKCLARETSGRFSSGACDGNNCDSYRFWGKLRKDQVQ